MPKFLKGRPAICDRCGFKKLASELKADGDNRGLMVCRPCWDSIDPWKLPARRPDDIAIPGASGSDLTPETE